MPARKQDAIQRKQLNEIIEKEFGVREEDSGYVDALIKYSHYMHILEVLGVNKPSENGIDVFHIAREKVLQERNRESQRTEIVKLNLIGAHTSAWNISHFHYERAIKVLCMMMVTIMDFILQEKDEESILYEGKKRPEYEELLNEITHLNDTYTESYWSICFFDFCTRKMGEFVGVSSYEKIAVEHNRVGDSGNPQRVTTALTRLKDLCGKQKVQIIEEIERTYTPEPTCTEAMMEECYVTAIKMYGTEEKALRDFTGLMSLCVDLYKQLVRG